MVVERRGGCLSGCGSTLAVLLLIGIAIRFWYVSVGLLVLVAAVGLIAGHRSRARAREAERRRSGPRDPWLNEIAVALGQLGLSEVARNTGSRLGGAPIEGDVTMQEDGLTVHVNLLADPELARQADVGLRAQQRFRDALAAGRVALQLLGPVLLVADGRGGVVDEYRLSEVAHAVGEVPLPPALTAPAAAGSTADAQAVGAAGAPAAAADPLEQIRALAELRDAGVLTEAEFEAKKAQLLRRV